MSNKQDKKVDGSKGKRYVKPTMYSEKVFEVGYDIGPMIVCNNGTFTHARGICLS